MGASLVSSTAPTRPTAPSRPSGAGRSRARGLIGIAPRGAAIALALFFADPAAPLRAQDPPKPPLDDWEDDWIEPGDPAAAQGANASFFDFDLVNGLRFQGPDGVPRLRVGGRFDLTGYLYDDRNSRDSETRLENSELRLDGEALGQAWLRVVADLDGRTTRDGLSEATLAGGRPRLARATAGLQQVPLGIESSIPDDELPFTGPAFSSWLVESTDLSMRVDGELLGGFFGYDAGFGAGEGFDADGDRVDDPRGSLRLVLYPLSPDGLVSELDGVWSFFQGIFISTSYAFESSFRRPIEIDTQYRNTLFRTTAMRAGGAEWWLHGWGIDAGRVRLYQEWTIGSLDDLDTTTGEEDLSRDLTTMAATISVRLLGDPEPYDSHPYRKRADLGVVDWSPPSAEHPTVPPLRFPGVVEAGLRYASGDMDQRFFDLGFADPAVSSQEFRTVTGSLSLRPSPYLRFIVECARTNAEGDPAGLGSSGHDTSFALRVELIF